jgi:hypothetical protein
MVAMIWGSPRPTPWNTKRIPIRVLPTPVGRASMQATTATYQAGANGRSLLSKPAA